MEYPKLTCPVCGMRIWFKNLTRFYEPSAWLIHLEGYKKIRYTIAPVKGDLIEFWIKRLEGVIRYLKSKSVLTTPAQNTYCLMMGEQLSSHVRSVTQKAYLRTTPSSCGLLARRRHTPSMRIDAYSM